jgi:hypothetical protein
MQGKESNLEESLKKNGSTSIFSELSPELLASIQALYDKGLCRQAFREINVSGFTPFMQLQYDFTRGLIAVQQAASAEKKKVFRSERTRIKSVMARHRATTSRADYRRCVIQMAKETGQRWVIILTWLGF